MAYCKAVSIPGGGTALVRFSGKRPICAVCGRTSKKLCDYPLTGSKAGKTCDRKLCAGCATSIGPDLDYCPTHYQLWLMGEL